jgi:hypothetical protein
MLTRALLIGAAAVASTFTGIALASPAAAGCTAVFGSLNDGVCLDQPAPPPPPGSPTFNWGGPGQGITSSPLFPGQSVTIPLG